MIGPPLRIYFEVARLTASSLTAYRGAALAGVFVNTVFGFLAAYILLGVYDQRTQVGGFDPVDAVTFVFVGQGLLMVVGVFGNFDMAERIRSGDVISDLNRPVDFQGWWAAAAFGRAAFFSTFRAIPPFLVAGLVFQLRVPTPGTWAVFAISVALAVAVSFAWFFLINLLAFWFLDIQGMASLGTVTALFLGGVFIPLVFFPGWTATVARALPFASMMQLPVEIFLDKHRGFGLLGVLSVQLAWAGALVTIGRLVLCRATRRIVVQGG